MAGGVASAARALVLLQLGVRVVTFCLNQVLVRATPPAVYGAANVQLDVVLSVVLFTIRDSVRSVALRRGPARVHDIALLAVPVGAAVAAGMGYVYMHALLPAELAAYGRAVEVSVALYYVGAVLELASEPLLVSRVGSDAFVGVRVAMEGAGVLVRACVTAALLTPAGLSAIAEHVLGGAPRAGAPLVAYGVGRAVYGAAVLCAAIGGVRAAVASMVRAYVPRWELDRETGALVGNTVVQALAKQVLAEGDKLVVARLAPLREQGGYALASNYGSLAARVLFQPVEESARLYLSGAPCARDAAALLHTLLHAHVLFALAVVAFGPPLAQAALVVLAGRAWAFDGAAPSGASRVLARYCYYLPVMGINGIVEAYMQSCASPRVLARYSYALFAASGVFGAALWVLRRWYAAEDALIGANALALAVRAGVSWVWLVRHVRRADAAAARQVGVAAVLPRAYVLGVYVFVAVVVRRVAEPLEAGAPVSGAVLRMAATAAAGVALVGGAIAVELRGGLSARGGGTRGGGRALPSRAPA